MAKAKKNGTRVGELPTAEIIGRCLEIIQPEPHKEDHCRADVDANILLLVKVHDDPGMFDQGHRHLERKYRDAAEALKGAAAIEWKFLARGETTQEAWQEMQAVLSRMADKAVQKAKEAAGLIPRTRPPDRLKSMCSFFAFDLLEDFSNRAPALTSDGPFYLLASVLYEAVTGKPNVSIEAACRETHRTKRQR
jgi:hypothetical protein